MRNHIAHRIEDMRDIQGLGHYEVALKNGRTEEEALNIARTKSRDYSCSPMQWNGNRYGGFSDQAPWIGMGPGMSRSMQKHSSSKRTPCLLL